MNWPKGTTAQVDYKVCDQGEYFLTGKDNSRIAKWISSYVPDNFLCHGLPGFGDYISFRIEADGKIASWKRPEINLGEWSAEPLALEANAPSLGIERQSPYASIAGISDRDLLDSLKGTAADSDRFSEKERIEIARAVKDYLARKLGFDF